MLGSPCTFATTNMPISLGYLKNRLIKARIAFFVMIGLAFLLAFPPQLTAQELASRRPSIGESFEDEALLYQISVLVFDNAAAGVLTLKKEGDAEYVGTLEAYTVGVIDRLYHRKDTYVSRLAEVDGGRRFITKSFEKTVDINGRIKKTFNTLDYDKRVLTWVSWKDGKEEVHPDIKFPADIYCDDPLAAFYNFRYGVYGRVQEGREFKIYTLPKEDKVPVIKMKITSREDLEKRTQGSKPYADYLADVKLGKELFGSGSGEVEIYFTDGLVPVEAVAKGIVFFGDVHGRLREIGVSMGFSTTPGVPARAKTAQ